MLAPGPAAGPPHALLQFLAGAADTALAGLGLFGVLDPADEFVARQGSNAPPGGQRDIADGQSVAQVIREFVYCPAGQPLGHALQGNAGRPKITGAEGARVATVRSVELDASAFSSQWVQAWNTHDVEAVLAHFHDDVLFTSPVAAAMFPETAGVIRGKAALRHYWTGALEHLTDLHFVVEGVYRGIDTVVINYRNQKGGLVNEVLRFDDDGLVIEGHGTYLVTGDPAATPTRTAASD